MIAFPRGERRGTAGLTGWFPRSFSRQNLTEHTPALPNSSQMEIPYVISAERKTRTG